MTNDIIYKVLWVDDQEDIVEGTKLDADEYGIELDHYSNWQEAEVALNNNFDDYSAIILDAFCRISPTEDIQEGFIHVVLPSLTTLFGKKNRLIPWYILSAGTMSRFSETIKIAAYHHQTSEWGQMEYIKHMPDEDSRNSHFLFNNIVRVAKEQANNIVLFRHKDVFKYLGKDKLIDERARKSMLKMLSALYYPEENLKYEYSGNPLRKVIEYLFWAARKQGLLPDQCFDGNEIKLQLASLFMAGASVSYDRNDKSKRIRWGNAGTSSDDGKGGDRIFDKEIESIVKNTLEYTNRDSHTSENAPWYIDEEGKDLFFGNVLQMCHVIKWFGNYVAGNPDVEENKKKHRLITINPEEQKPNRKVRREEQRKTNQETSRTAPLRAEDIKGKTFLIMKDGATLFCGSCKLDATILLKSGPVILDDVIPNEGDDKEKYPYIATKVSQVK